MWVLAFEISHRPMGDSRFARCLQGGGVDVAYGSVSIVNSQIYSNTANYVRADIRKFPSPRWENALLTCFCDLHCKLSFPSPRPGAQCLCQRRQRRLLRWNDPHRRYFAGTGFWRRGLLGPGLLTAERPYGRHHRRRRWRDHRRRPCSALHAPPGATARAESP